MCVICAYELTSKESGAESTIEDGIKTIRIYNAASRFSFLKGLFGAIKYYYSCLKGLEAIKKEFGNLILSTCMLFNRLAFWLYLLIYLCGFLMF
jgi:hypothetical protein